MDIVSIINWKKNEQKRFQVVNKSMQIKSVRKTQFAGLNDKSFYFHDGIVSLPFAYFLLEKTWEEKEKQKRNTYINSKKNVWVFNFRKPRCTFMWEVESIKIYICSTTVIVQVRFSSSNDI